MVRCIYDMVSERHSLHLKFYTFLEAALPVSVMLGAAESAVPEKNQLQVVYWA